MKSHDTILRLKRFEVQEKTRQLAQLDTIIAEFDRMSCDLDSQIEHEEQKSGISDQTHFAYPTLAKAVRNRRDNLMTSLNDLKDQRAAARLSLLEVEEELAKTEKLYSRSSRRSESNESPPRAMMG